MSDTEQMRCWICDGTREFKSAPCPMCIDEGRIAAPTPPAEAQVEAGGLLHDIDWIARHLAEPDKAARSKYRGVDAIHHVAQNLRRKITALSAQPRPEGDLYDTILAAVIKSAPRQPENDRPESHLLAFRELESIAGAVFAAVFPMAQPASAPVGVES